MVDDQQQPRERDEPDRGEQTRVPSVREEIRAAADDGLLGRWAARRRQRIAAELERNRRGEYKVPTWVLAAILVAFVAAWVLLIALV